MKKIIRNVWIGALSGLAFLTACSDTKGLSRQERRQLLKERDNIQDMLRAREGECLYGSPEVMASYQVETCRLQNRLDSINAKLGKEIDLEASALRLRVQERRAELLERISSLRSTIFERENACVYGSPEIIEEYGRETRRLRGELEKIEKELKGLDIPF